MQSEANHSSPSDSAFGQGQLHQEQQASNTVIDIDRSTKIRQVDWRLPGYI